MCTSPYDGGAISAGGPEITEGDAKEGHPDPGDPRVEGDGHDRGGHDAHEDRHTGGSEHAHEDRHTGGSEHAHEDRHTGGSEHAHEEGHAHEDGHSHAEDEGLTTEQVWERMYTERGQRWSGRPNQRLVEVAGDLPPGRALDLGCGEGGDAVWLARRGWEVTAVDVSPTALGRLRAQADAEGVADRIDTVQMDLAVAFPTVPDGGWDLVSAQFFQSTISLPRTAILRRAASATAPGGLLLVVEHGEAPPWSNHHDVVFPTVDETVAELALAPGGWSAVRVERSSRDADGPDGRRAELVDNIVALRRVP